MTVTLTIELGLAVILLTVITTFIILAVKDKVSKNISIITCVVFSSVMISAMLFVALSDQPTFLVNGQKY